MIRRVEQSSDHCQLNFLVTRFYSIRNYLFYLFLTQFVHIYFAISFTNLVDNDRWTAFKTIPISNNYNLMSNYQINCFQFINLKH